MDTTMFLPNEKRFKWTGKRLRIARKRQFYPRSVMAVCLDITEDELIAIEKGQKPIDLTLEERILEFFMAVAENEKGFLFYWMFTKQGFKPLQEFELD